MTHTLNESGHENALDSLEGYDDILVWINDTLTPTDSSGDLADLHQQINGLLDTLEFACESTSSTVESTIDSVSRTVPRLAYDLQFMRDGAVSLQTTLRGVHESANSAIPPDASAALEQLKQLHTMRVNMEAAREVLREAESWSTLEMEITSLLTERSYAKAATRLSEANKSMVVFQNTPEYDPRRALMVNLQNQLEASLSSALVSAINTQDLASCREYYTIFADIQREPEYRNYYNGSRRSSIVQSWQGAILSDTVNDSGRTEDSSSLTLAAFMPSFYSTFLSVLNTERMAIPSIFPDPSATMSSLVMSVLSALTPSFSERLTSLNTHRGDTILKELIAIFKTTEEFSINVHKIMEKVKYSRLTVTPEDATKVADSGAPAPSAPSHTRRRSMRMSMSLRTGSQRSLSGNQTVSQAVAETENIEWDQDLFQPFLDFQTDYSSLERRFLDSSIQDFTSRDLQSGLSGSDRARLLRDRAIDVFGAAEESVGRCVAFTYGYGTIGLLQALDGFLKNFVDTWTADISIAPTSSSITESASDGDLADLDYTDQDWSEFQQTLHLLSSARSLHERSVAFNLKLKSSIAQVASKFRLSRTDPGNFPLTPCRGEASLLEQSSLNSAELAALFDRAENLDDAQGRDTLSNRRHSMANSSAGSSDTLLPECKSAIFSFAGACQTSLQRTLLSPLRKHFSSYPTSPLWSQQNDANSRRTGGANELQVPSFSLSPSETIQRVTEGLLNLPRLFEVYAGDDAVSFSLHTLPHVDGERLLSAQAQLGHDASPSLGHGRKQSLSGIPSTAQVDPETVSTAWLSSIGSSLLVHVTTEVLPKIGQLTDAGAAQLSSDLGYLSTISGTINADVDTLDKWKEYVDLDKESGLQVLNSGERIDGVLREVARMRNWRL